MAETQQMTCQKKEVSGPSKLRPLGNRVLVQRLEAEEKLKGGLVLPDSAKKKQEQAKVVAIGTGKKRQGWPADSYSCRNRRYHPHGKILGSRSCYRWTRLYHPQSRRPHCCN